MTLTTRLEKLVGLCGSLRQTESKTHSTTLNVVVSESTHNKGFITPSRGRAREIEAGEGWPMSML